MNSKKIKTFIIITLLLSTSCLMGLSETDKITTLLDMIENSKLVFIRNGTEYAAPKARQHLQMKLQRAGLKIKTAEDFIKYIASKSSWTGRHYYIKHPNGIKEKSMNWLRKNLRRIEGSKKN